MYVIVYTIQRFEFVRIGNNHAKLTCVKQNFFDVEWHVRLSVEPRIYIFEIFYDKKFHSVTCRDLCTTSIVKYKFILKKINGKWVFHSKNFF